MTKPELIRLIKKFIAREGGISQDEIRDSDSFFDLGLDSVSCIFIMEKLEKELTIELNPIFFWDYPTIELYSDYLVSRYFTTHAN